MFLIIIIYKFLIIIIYVMHDTVGGEVEEEAEVEDRPGDHHKYYTHILLLIYVFNYYNL